MGYYVIGPDGTKYGPAEIAVLQKWVAEGWIHQATVLEEDGSGQRVAAEKVPELGLGAAGQAVATAPMPTPAASAAPTWGRTPHT